MFHEKALVKPETLSELIAKFEQKIRDLEAFKPYYEKVKDFVVSGHRGGDSIDYDATEDRLKKDAWAEVIDKTQLYSLMSLEASAKLQKTLYNRGSGYGQEDETEIPPFTYDNIMAFLDQQQNNMPTMMADKIVEVYKLLRPGNYYKLKTNATSLFEGIGKKVILGYFFDVNYSGGLRIRYQRREEINAIQEIFLLLDGKGVAKDGDKLYYKMENAERAELYEDDYLKIKGYNNGNAHIEFKRMDLVKQILSVAKEKLLGKVA